VENRSILAPRLLHVPRFHPLPTAKFFPHFIAAAARFLLISFRQHGTTTRTYADLWDVFLRRLHLPGLCLVGLPRRSLLIISQHNLFYCRPLRLVIRRPVAPPSALFLPCLIPRKFAGSNRPQTN
jgi:hypothetical protein